MPPRILKTSCWLLPALAAVALLPTTSQAAHRIDHAILLPAAEAVHYKVQEFEAIACQRPFPPHELTYIRLMTTKACRLVDDVRACAPYGRIKADYNVLQAFARVVDVRLNRRCASYHDYEFLQSWNCVQSEIGAIGCLVSGCPSGCALHHGAPHGVPYGAPPHQEILPPAEELLPPIPPQPAAYRDVDRFSRRDRGRYAPQPARNFDRELDFPTAGVDPRLERRSQPAAPPWLELLLAALAR